MLIFYWTPLISYYYYYYYGRAAHDAGHRLAVVCERVRGMLVGRARADPAVLFVALVRLCVCVCVWVFVWVYGSDGSIKMYLRHLEETRKVGNGECFIIQDLGELGLFVKSPMVPDIEAKVKEMLDSNHFDREAAR